MIIKNAILPKEINDSVVVIFCDRAFRAFDGKVRYGFVIWVGDNLFSTGSVGGAKVSSAKEAEARVLLSAICIPRQQGFSLVHFASNSQDVIQALKGLFEGWSRLVYCTHCF